MCSLGVTFLHDNSAHSDALVEVHCNDLVCFILQEAAPAAANGAPRAEGFDLDLTDCSGVWLADNSLLLGLASGQLILVNVQIEGSSAKRLKVSGASQAQFP